MKKEKKKKSSGRSWKFADVSLESDAIRLRDETRSAGDSDVKMLVMSDGTFRVKWRRHEPSSTKSARKEKDDVK